MKLSLCLIFFVINSYPSGDPSAEEKGAFRGLHSRSLPDISSLGRGVQMFNLGFGYAKKGDNHNATKWFLEAVRHNEPRAMNYLGMYSLREGHEDEAEQWFDQGMKLGDVISKYNLASLYHQKGDAAQESGKMEESQKYIGTAVKLYSEIVASYSGAKNNLAVILYEQGKEDQALKLWQEAKAEGYASAIFNVAWVADQKGDNETAKIGYEQVAKKGDLDAMFYLAKIHEKEKDLENATFWYKKLAEKGDSEGMFYLANIHEQENDLESAKLWYKKLSEKGYSYVMFHLAKIHEKEGDLLSAKHWYKKAAEKGDLEAMAKVKEMGSGNLKQKCIRTLSFVGHHQ